MSTQHETYSIIITLPKKSKSEIDKINKNEEYSNLHKSYRHLKAEPNILDLVYNGNITKIADFFNIHYKEDEQAKTNFLKKFKNSDDMSLLHISSFMNYTNIYLFLIKMSIDMNSTDSFNRNFLHITCFKGHTQILNIIFNWIGFQSKMSSIERINHIYNSHGFGKMDIIKGKLSSSIYLNEVNTSRFSSLQVKLKEEIDYMIDKNLEFFKILLSAKDKFNKTPLHYAAINKFSTSYLIFNYLVDYNIFSNLGWDEFLNVIFDVNDLEIKDERKIDPRKSLRIEKELINLLGEDIIKEVLITYNSRKRQILLDCINSQDYNGDTVLHIASYFGDFKIVKRLLLYGADSNKVNNKSMLPVDLSKDDYVRKVFTSLNKAAKNSDIKSINELVNFGHDLNLRQTIFSQAPLHKVIESNKQNKHEVLKNLLDMGADPNIKDSNGWTALHYACQLGDSNSVMTLCEYYKSIDILSNNNRTPLHFASFFNFPEIVQFLLSKGANPNIKDNNGCFPIHLASKQGNLSCINLLLAYGSEIYSTDTRSWNILHYASFYGHPESIKYICKYDSDKGILENSSNSRNKSPIEIIKNPLMKPYFKNLWSLAKDAELDVIRELYNKGDDVNEESTFYKNTPLHLAVFNNNYLTVKLLLKLGADMNVRNKDGLTSFDYAEVMNDKIHNMISSKTDRIEKIDLREILRNILNMKEKQLNFVVSKKNTCLEYSHVLDFSDKIRELFNKAQVK